jgi:hypothetical protein
MNKQGRRVSLRFKQGQLGMGIEWARVEVLHVKLCLMYSRSRSLCELDVAKNNNLSSYMAHEAHNIIISFHAGENLWPTGHQHALDRVHTYD